MAEIKIETGADRLVSLISRKNRISVDDAAKELDVGKDVILEWAEFLEDEGVISIEEHFTTTYLCEAKLDEPDLEKKSKGYAPKKDAFIEQVEIAMVSMQNEFQNFENIKEEFQKLNVAVGVDMNTLTKDMSELKYYESLKENLEKELKSDKEHYQKILDGIQKTLNESSEKYIKYMDSISSQIERLIAAKKEASELKSQIEQYKIQVDHLLLAVSSLPKQIDQQKKLAAAALIQINQEEDYADESEDNLGKILTEDLMPLVEKIKAEQFMTFLQIRKDSLALQLSAEQELLTAEKQHELYGAINEISSMIAELEKKRDEK